MTNVHRERRMERTLDRDEKMSEERGRRRREDERTEIGEWRRAR